MKKVNTRFQDVNLSFGIEENELIERTRDGVKTFQLKARFRSSNHVQIDALNEEKGVLKTERITNTDSVLLFFSIDKKGEINSIIDAYINSGLVEYIEPHVMLDLQNSQDLIEVEEELTDTIPIVDNDLYNDTHYKLLWHFKNTGQFDGTPGEDISLEAAFRYIKKHGISLKKQKIRIAVLDDGIDPSHKDLDPDKNVDSFDLMDNDDIPTPTGLLTHGTNIAGVISAVENNELGVSGISPLSLLVVGRIYGRSASAHLPVRAAKGIREAVERKARIINLSWGFKNPSSEIIDAIHFAKEKGVLVVVAAGNYNRSNDSKVLFPGNMDSVLTVGACDHKGRWINLRNCLANPKFGSRFGRSLDIVAPGYKIITTQYDHPTYPNRHSFKSFHGTSVATAIVSAVASILLMAKPDLTAQQLKHLILSNTDDLKPTNPPSVGNDHVGHGRINVLKAIKSLHKLL